jgi:hypothetical protein
VTKIEKEKHDMLLLWFQSAKSNNGRVTMEEFDKRFQWLFRKRALPISKPRYWVCYDK